MNTSGLRRIGLTGGIGSGKSTLAQIFSAQGIPVIDADAISRQLTAAGGDAMPAIAREFGADFLTADASLNRTRMRELVFSQPDARLKLQAVLHPLIAKEIQIQEVQAIENNNSLVVIDIPLLVESMYWRSRLNRVLVVDCEEDTQVRRVVKRSQLSPDEVLSIMRQQASRKQRLAAADWVISNNQDDLAHLQKLAQAIQLHF
jgi:dephospho-CoA kinase